MIGAINLVNPATASIPKYILNNNYYRIEFYLDNSGQVLTVGVVDNNYICWASLTKTDEVQKNEEIFNHIAHRKYLIVSELYKALASIGLKYDDLDSWYHGTISQALEKGMAWKTPWDHYYGEKQEKDNGRFFANDIKNCLDNLHNKCRFREAGGTYISVLEESLRILKNSQNDECYYKKVEALADILRQESYLIVSEDAKVRELYLKIKREISLLYNRYMTVVR